MTLVETKILDNLFSNTTTARVFIYLRLKDKPLGVREIQRALEFSSPSSVHWHLNKLIQHNIIEQLVGSKYKITEPYSTIKKIPISIMLDHYFIRGKAVPNVFILLSFLTLNLFSILILLIMNMPGHAAIIGLLSLVVTMVLVIQFYFHITKKLTS
ncbi:MAG: hypothetical protein ACFFB5_12625 [Promethearchaeota archaeon]